MVRQLLGAIKLRIRDDDNQLHTEEQLLLYAGCASRVADSSNSNVLADLLEAKYTDTNHVFELVKFVLGYKYVPNTSGLQYVVRDSALRAMMRLERSERDDLHRNLLRGRQGALPLQVLFSLVVTELAEDVQPLVVRQLAMLEPPAWGELLSLIKEANPMYASCRPPHTYPRAAAVAPLFGERFLRRYLHDQPHLPRQTKEAVAAHPEKSGWGQPREPRYFLLFAACTPRPAGRATWRRCSRRSG